MNQKFLNSADARTLRILAEYLEPLARFRRQNVKDTIVMFGSARTTDRETAELALAKAKAEGSHQSDATIRRLEAALRLSEYYEAARELARRLTAWSKEQTGDHSRYIICSGGGPGIMEAANRGALEAGGKSIGLGISLPYEPGENRFITPELLFEFHYFFMRKYWFVYLAKALIIFPGGFGTLDELFECLTLVQTHKVRKKMPIVLYGTEYWDAVLNFQTLVDYGAIAPEDAKLVHRSDSVDDALDYLTRELTRLYADGQPGKSKFTE